MNAPDLANPPTQDTIPTVVESSATSNVQLTVAEKVEANKLSMEKIMLVEKKLLVEKKVKVVLEAKPSMEKKEVA